MELTLEDGEIPPHVNLLKGKLTIGVLKRYNQLMNRTYEGAKVAELKGDSEAVESLKELYAFNLKKVNEIMGIDAGNK